MAIPGNIYDREYAKFSEIGSGTVAVNVTLVGGASGYAEGTTVGTATGNVIVFRGTGGTTAVVGTATPLPVTLQTLLSGEDLTNNVFRVEGQFSGNNITTTGTTVVKAAAGFLHTLTINTPVASSVITLYDNTAASGTKLATITLPATLLMEGPDTAIYDLLFTTGLTIVTATGASDITVSYR